MSLYTYPELSEEEDRRLWDDALMVLDTSALCSFYNLSDYYRNIIIQIFEYFSKRLWIPYQVKYEYERNRNKAIHNPIYEQYSLPNFCKNSFVKDVQSQIDQWQKNKYYHPFLKPDRLRELNGLIIEATKSIRQIKEIVESEYAARISEIKGLESSDSLKDFIDRVSCSEPLTYKEIKKIIQEGEFRYRNELPPGYMDGKLFNGQEPKKGIRKYGDLIIWKDILSHAKVAQKDVILIIDDCKEDWYEHDNSVIRPRIELLTEFEESTGKKIWFYTTQQFIEELKKHYHEKEEVLPLYDKLEDVILILERLAKEKKLRASHFGDEMLVECNNCHKIITLWSDELDWEMNGSYERGMGPEYEWIAQHDLECPCCGNSIEIDSFISEYPEGMFNYETTECYGAEIRSRWSLENIFTTLHECDDEEEEDSCIRCGARGEVDDSGLCPDCKAELKRKIESDD